MAAHSLKKYPINSINNSGELDNGINGIVMDKEHGLWVGTGGGVNLLDEKTQKFYTYNNTNSNLSDLAMRCSFIDRSQGNLVWSVSGSKLFKQ